MCVWLVHSSTGTIQPLLYKGEPKGRLIGGEVEMRVEGGQIRLHMRQLMSTWRTRVSGTGCWLTAQ